MSRRGRPSKLTPERKERIIKAIKAGAHYKTACQHAGIDYRTFRNWMKKGEQAKTGRYRDFYLAVTKANADLEVYVVGNWTKAISEDWRAAKDFLAKRFPDRWGHNLTITQEEEDQPTRRFVARWGGKHGDRD